MKTRYVLKWIAFAFAAVVAVSGAKAADWKPTSDVEFVIPYGLGGGQILEADAALGVPEAATAGEGGALSAGGDDAGAPVTAQRQYSTTNTHEAGVDEPDLVKTDGQRIVTVTGSS